MVVKNPRNTDPPDDTPTPSDTAAEAAAAAAIIAAMIGGGSSSARTIQLPEGYSPPPRTGIIGTSEAGAQGRRPIVGQITGRGLVNQFGELEKLPDKSIREEYTDDEIRFEWLGLPYEVRKKYIEQFQEIGIISKRQVLDPNLTGNTELAAFSSVLANANIEGRTWRAVLPVMASRAKAFQTESAGYRPTSIADIRKAMQAQATSILGRGLTPQEAKPLAQRIQEQETRQQTRKSGDQATSTSTLIEQGVQKDFGAEAQAFNFARFAQSALGYAGSSAGAQPDVELETMGGM